MAVPRSPNSGKGIAFMLAGMFLFSAVDTLAKFLTDSFHPLQVVWFRMLGLILGVLVLLALRGFVVLHTKNFKLQITRGVLAACSASLFIMAVSFVPLADAVAVSFVAPFIVTVLGALVLKEKVGVRRWSAVTIGFIGTLIVVRPGLGVMHPAVLLVVAAAGFFAMRQILSRMLSSGDKTSTTVAYTALVSTLLLTIPLPFVWQMPQSGFQILLVVSMAVLAAVAEILVIKALEIAEAVVIAPVHYSLILWGTAYGYFVFGQLPDHWTWFGTAIIVASGLYTIYRDWAVRQQTAND